MRRLVVLILSLGLGAGTAFGADLTRKVRLGRVSIGGGLPADLVRPEGTSRWDLTLLKHRDRLTVSLEAEGNAVTLLEERRRGNEMQTARTVYSDIDGTDGAVRWFFPDRYSDSLRPGSRQILEFDEESEHRLDRLRVEVRTIGIGWVHLPSGPHEIVLQRALILRSAGGGRAFEPDALIHRWVDPRAGIVAEVSGPASPDGRSRLRASAATTLEEVIEGASTLKIHVSELPSEVFTEIRYGFDKGEGTSVSSLDPNGGYTTIGELILADTWDFSGNTTGVEVAFTTVPVNSQQTCNFAQCGYTDPNSGLERSDKNFDDTDPNNWAKGNTTIVTEDRPGDVTIWLRAASVKEGVSGAFGTGESRLCYVTFDSVTRTEVPLWRFSHLDPNAAERHLQAGDFWEGGPFNCEQNLFNQVCGASQLFDHLWSKACGSHAGTQSTEVLKGGVVTLPSGHTFNALMVRTTADFCVYLNTPCRDTFPSQKVDEVRTVNYLWQVPSIGTVTRLQSEQNVPDPNTFTTLVETDISFGLFPPRSISVTAETDHTVSLSWDPGLITHRITGYKIYWDTDSGSATDYAFNSDDDPNQVSFAGTTADISGLDAGTDYYFTVTSLTVYPPDPNTQTLPRHTYESILYPTVVSGDPSFVYPVEVQATTTGGVCIPTEEISGVTVDDAGGGDIQICWSPSSDPCLTGYQILGSMTADSDAGFTPVADLGPQTCWTGSPAETFFIVVVRGTGGNGPWGHYGH